MADVDVREGIAWSPVFLDIPSLRSRSSELLRIVSEYANDAITSLRAPAGCFEVRDAEWVMRHFAVTIPEIEKETLRVVAINASKGHLAKAASMLGMHPVSLTSWLGRRAYDHARERGRRDRPTPRS
jgi:DNA-binding NtrC family response regulator